MDREASLVNLEDASVATVNLLENTLNSVFVLLLRGLDGSRIEIIRGASGEGAEADQENSQRNAKSLKHADDAE